MNDNNITPWNSNSMIYDEIQLQDMQTDAQIDADIAANRLKKTEQVNNTMVKMATDIANSRLQHLDNPHRDPVESSVVIQDYLNLTNTYDPYQTSDTISTANTQFQQQVQQQQNQTNIFSNSFINSVNNNIQSNQSQTTSNGTNTGSTTGQNNQQQILSTAEVVESSMRDVVNLANANSAGTGTKRGTLAPDPTNPIPDPATKRQRLTMASFFNLSPIMAPNDTPQANPNLIGNLNTMTVHDTSVTTTGRTGQQQQSAQTNTGQTNQQYSNTTGQSSSSNTNSNQTSSTRQSAMRSGQSSNKLNKSVHWQEQNNNRKITFVGTGRYAFDKSEQQQLEWAKQDSLKANTRRNYGTLDLNKSITV
ncbi:MAG: hypothetical protein ACPG2Y_02705, partial [Acholeplasmataceae bacterium]